MIMTSTTPMPAATTDENRKDPKQINQPPFRSDEGNIRTSRKPNHDASSATYEQSTGVIQNIFTDIELTIKKVFEKLFLDCNPPHDGSNDVCKTASKQIQSAFAENEIKLNDTLNEIVIFDKISQDELNRLINVMHASFRRLNSAINYIFEALFTSINQSLEFVVQPEHIFDGIRRIFKQNIDFIELAFKNYSSPANSTPNISEPIFDDIRTTFKQNGNMIFSTVQSVIPTKDANKTNLSTVIRDALQNIENTTVDELKKVISLENQDAKAFSKIIDGIQDSIKHNEHNIFNATEEFIIKNEHSKEIPCEDVKRLRDALIIAFKLNEINLYHALQTIIIHGHFNHVLKIFALQKIAKVLEESAKHVEDLAYGDFEQRFNDMLNKINKFPNASE